MPASVRSTAPPLVAACLAGLGAPLAAAQGLPLADPPELLGSPAFVAAAPGLTSGGGRGESGGHAAESAVQGPLGGGYAAASPSFSVRGASAVLAPSQLGSSGPLVTAVLPRTARASGEAVDVYGLGLAGLGPDGLRFDGLPAASVSVVDDTHLIAVTPELTNDVGNPRGPVDVTVESNAGTGALAEALIATPAYLRTSTARVGSTYTVTHFGPPGAVGVPSWAAPIPGVVVPVPGIAGAIELAQIFVTFPAETLGADGVSSTVLAIPDSPQLAGLTIHLQSVVIESFAPLVASFTNTVAFEIEP